LVKPAAPPQKPDFDFEYTGPVWWLGLNNDQTNDLDGVMVALAPFALAIYPPIAAALTGGAAYIKMVNEVFGSNGVDINGVVGTEGLVVTPRVGKFYNDLIQAARDVVAGRTILDFLVIAANEVPALASTLNISVVASVLSLMEAGNPLGWALAGALGLATSLVGSEPDPNQHGHIWANRDQAGAWESFILAQIAPGNKVSLLSWQGLFSAQQGGGGDVYANRPTVGDWETWTLINNNDGTVSFETSNGNYLSAEQGGGVACYANRKTIGDWEKFALVTLTDGKVALKTHLNGKFVSVQQ
jgi:hypothetical protein